MLNYQLDLQPGAFGTAVNRHFGLEQAKTIQDKSLIALADMKKVFTCPRNQSELREVFNMGSAPNIHKDQARRSAKQILEMLFVNSTNIFRFLDQRGTFMGGLENHIKIFLGFVFIIYKKLLAELKQVKQVQGEQFKLNIEEFKKRFLQLMKSSIDVSLGWTTMRIDFAKKLIFSTLGASQVEYSRFHMFQEKYFGFTEDNKFRATKELQVDFINQSEHDLNHYGYLNYGESEHLARMSTCRRREVCPATRVLPFDDSMMDLVTYTHNLLCDHVEAVFFPHLDALITKDLNS